MCGIVAYTGRRPASPILLDGLHVLEYRGYDSAGIYVPGSGVYRAVGPVAELAARVPGVLSGTAGIGHTRWATHGRPTEKNAHPHHDQTGRVWLVHNGIIENYIELREGLVAEGHMFESDTDTEVLAHLIGGAYEKERDLARAVTSALARVQGTYGIAVMVDSLPDTILVARMGSPIAIGVRDGEYFAASDTAPLLRHTRNVLHLEDGEYALLTPTGFDVCTFDHARIERMPETVTMSIEEAQRGSHPHFMLKEILEVPTALENGIRGRVSMREGAAHLGGFTDHDDVLRAIDRVVIVGCGSAYYAGMVGKLMIEELAGIPVSVEVASEFRHRTLLAQKNTALIAISQSGETADTIASLREAKRRGMLTIGVVNVVGSSVARETDLGVYNHAGPEIGVASTKTFVSQLATCALVALAFGRMRGLGEARGAELCAELMCLPDKVRTILAGRESIRELAEEYLGYDDFFFIGRRFNVATAYEGALKLKEVSYVHAEGYGAGEMKHGPIALIDESFPTIAIMPSDPLYEKMCSSVAEIRARGGRVLAIATEGNESVRPLVDDVIYLPYTHEMYTPFLVSVVLQLFAYYSGVLRGFNVDRPRNLAKSVTVE